MLGPMVTIPQLSLKRQLQMRVGFFICFTFYLSALHTGSLLYLIFPVFVRSDHKSVAIVPQNAIVAFVSFASSPRGDFLSSGQVGVDSDSPGKDSKGKGPNHFH